MQEIHVQQFHSVLTKRDSNVLCLDVRTKSEYQDDHIEGVKHIPMDQIDDSVEELREFDALYIHCAKGGRSRNVCQKLESLGLSNLYNVDGGICEWMEAGLPVKTQKRTIPISRQIQIAQGTLIIVGILLMRYVSFQFVWLLVVVAVTLLNNGLRESYILDLIFRKFPWNS